MTRPACALGFEPPMFRGLGGTELTAVIVLSLGPGLAGSAVVCLWAGSLLWAPPVLVLSAFGSVLCGGTVLRRLKRNRSPNWYLQRAARRLGPRAGLVWRDGPWRTER